MPHVSHVYRFPTFSIVAYPLVALKSIAGTGNPLLEDHIDVVALQCAVAPLGHDQFRAANFAFHPLPRLVHGDPNVPFHAGFSLDSSFLHIRNPSCDYSAGLRRPPDHPPADEGRQYVGVLEQPSRVIAEDYQVSVQVQVGCR